MTWVYFCAVLSAVFAGLTAVLAKMGLEGISSNLATTIRVIMLVPLLIGVVAVQGVIGQAWTLTARNWIFLGLSALATGLSWLFYFYALSQKDATWVAPIDKTSLVFTFLFAMMIGKETMTWQKSVACVLVLGAMGVMLLEPKPMKPAMTTVTASAEKK
jgi:transporter family protein